ncbi:MAG: manganese efflux pump MntP family protein [Bacteroidales bacterium]|jgi:putative Mn2+ efflux pump MntP|nr:manganese efflux pump MntP family protein [Bacteroidales bacterium]
MGTITLLLIAVGLSFDTFAVSVSTGLTVSRIRFRTAVRVACILAFFQAVMPLIGWIAGELVAERIARFDHWIAFGLLFILGAKMIYESFREEDMNSNTDPLRFGSLVMMAIATSIDALVVGVSFAFVDQNIYWSIAVIGCITFLVAMLGMLFGKMVGGRLGKRMEIVGGLILIGIGIKILVEHL